MSVPNITSKPQIESDGRFKELFLSEKCADTKPSSQDDSHICYIWHENNVMCSVKCYSVDSSLNVTRWQKYNCHPDVERLVLGSSSRKCSSCVNTVYSSSLLPPDGASESDTVAWRPRLEANTRINIMYNTRKNLPRKIRKYYKAQNKLIKSFDDTDCLDVQQRPTVSSEPVSLAKLSFFANLFFAILKSVAATWGSMSVIASLVDSVVDTVACGLMWWSSTAVLKPDPYVYPVGRTRLQPISVIILSVLMSFASIFLIVEAVERMISLYRNEFPPPFLHPYVVAVNLLTAVLKFGMYYFCVTFSSQNVAFKALMKDHRNDAISNTFAVVFAFMGSRDMIIFARAKNLKYIDPVGALLFSIYIMVSWWNEGIDQVKYLTGHTADPAFLSKLTWLCLNHHPHIKQIDTVRAFHFGKNFLVEVDIVLPHDMRINVSHDIGESLQHKLERLQEVERAFVHLDYETSHNPNHEHKIV